MAAILCALSCSAAFRVTIMLLANVTRFVDLAISYGELNDSRIKNPYNYG